jgi:hypothetical protein
MPASGETRMKTVISSECFGDFTENLFRGKCDVMRVEILPLFEIALMLVRFDQVASRIVNANHSIM